MFIVKVNTIKYKMYPKRKKLKDKLNRNLSSTNVIEQKISEGINYALS